MSRPLPRWLKPNVLTCHMPTKTVFQASRCQRDRSTSNVYLMDINGHDYPLAECDLLRLEHFQGIALMIIPNGVLSVSTNKEGLVVTSDRKAVEVHLPQFSDSYQAAQVLARFFDGVITHSEEVT